MQTETTTCLCVCGPKKNMLVTGCHSGNINIHKSHLLLPSDVKTIYQAHQNLIRVVTSLDSLNNSFFLTADVCGTIKVWPIDITPKTSKDAKPGSASHISFSVNDMSMASETNNASGGHPNLNRKASQRERRSSTHGK